ncbi:heterokaryon incompatibility protein-domain-containing protein [Stachybotrys elegans]|uniref:Heterokaryon incompatibility protein-domain-containing protein n=1 Tax=Stachybotrys elegans TaxID=80388 RepID=A0A8K0SV28_9HYPO|nr:heterokaryon incompatibility protein-domain-containing protein [Stachybotrys elegans]
MSSYTYEPLCRDKQEIRLMSLLPALDTPQDEASMAPTSRAEASTIRASIHKADLTEDLVFLALSYVWGSENNRSTIQVDGFSLPITQNLLSALKHIQDSTEPVTLWIDAICINQSDKEEKSWQVQNMKQIYKKARGTIVWLGEDIDGAGHVMAGFSNPSLLLQSLLDFDKLIQQYDVSSPHDASKALQSLLNRGYFFRIWCLQEFCVSDNVTMVCGDHRVALDSFYEIANIMKGCIYTRVCTALGTQEFPMAESATRLFASQLGPDGANRMFNQRQQLRRSSRESHVGNNGGASTLLHLLVSAFTHIGNDVTLRSTDPRDLVYGLLGLASDTDQLCIRPDYKKSCEEVFIETWSAILAKSSAAALGVSQYGRQRVAAINEDATAPGIAIFSGRFSEYGLPRLDFTAPGGQDLPSWVPDWRVLRDPCISSDLMDKPFNACGQRSETRWVSTKEDVTIALKGVRVDMVKGVGTTMSLVKDHITQGFQPAATFLTEIAKFLQESINPDRVRPFVYTAAQVEEGVWRIPITDRQVRATGRNDYERATSISTEAYLFLMRVISAWDQAQGSTDRMAVADLAFMTATMERMGTFGSYMRLMMTNCGRKPFYTEKGYVGLGPYATEVGDVVAIFDGAPIPFILRPKEGLAYQLLGEGYMYGLMDGEFIQDDTDECTFVLV